MAGVSTATRLALLSVLLQGSGFVGDAFVLAPRAASANTCKLLSATASTLGKNEVVCWCASIASCANWIVDRHMTFGHILTVRTVFSTHVN